MNLINRIADIRTQITDLNAELIGLESELMEGY